MDNKVPRKDNYGTPIEKGGSKKHKIVFADSPTVAHKDTKLEDVYIVESFKQFNTDMSRNNNTCCSIF